MNDNDRVFLHGKPCVYRGANFEVRPSEEGCYWISLDYLPNFRVVVFRDKSNFLKVYIQKDDQDCTFIVQATSDNLNVNILDNVFNELNTKFGEYLDKVEKQIRDVAKVFLARL